MAQSSTLGSLALRWPWGKCLRARVGPRKPVPGRGPGVGPRPAHLHPSSCSCSNFYAAPDPEPSSTSAPAAPEGTAHPAEAQSSGDARLAAPPELVLPLHGCRRPGPSPTSLPGPRHPRRQPAPVRPTLPSGQSHLSPYSAQRRKHVCAVLGKEQKRQTNQPEGEEPLPTALFGSLLCLPVS